MAIRMTGPVVIRLSTGAIITAADVNFTYHPGGILPSAPPLQAYAILHNGLRLALPFPLGETVTTATERLELIRADARSYKPPAIGRILGTVITFVFVALGWLAGATWYSAMFCFAAARYGFRQGAHIDTAPAKPPRQ